jgi:hypothetical protein
MDAVVGREVADSFELIWPTGEIDEQYLGGPLWEMSPPDVRFTDIPRPIVPSPASEPMTVRLRPLTAPPEVLEPAPEPVSVDVVLAIQRAIAAIGSDAVVEAALIDGPPAGTGLACSATGSSMAEVARPADRANPGARIELGPASDATDERRSALKRLIGGLRRR